VKALRTAVETAKDSGSMKTAKDGASQKNISKIEKKVRELRKFCKNRPLSHLQLDLLSMIGEKLLAFEREILKNQTILSQKTTNSKDQARIRKQAKAVLGLNKEIILLYNMCSENLVNLMNSRDDDTWKELIIKSGSIWLGNNAWKEFIARSRDTWLGANRDLERQIRTNILINDKSCREIEESLYQKISTEGDAKKSASPRAAAGFLLPCKKSPENGSQVNDKRSEKLKELLKLAIGQKLEVQKSTAGNSTAGNVGTGGESGNAEISSTT
jgi:hypothetical protein